MKTIMDQIDNILDRITMYRLVLYFLTLLFILSLFFSFFGLLPFTPVDLLFSTVIILSVSVITNFIFSKIFNAPTNIESVYISALILILIITPPQFINYLSTLSFLVWVSVWTMASKYIFAIGKKHLFNPVAFSVALLALTVGKSATWWVGGGMPLLPFVLVGGILIVRKIKRTDLVLSFLLSFLFSIVAIVFFGGGDPLSSVWKAIIHSPIFFFAFVMLTEPLTTPPTRLMRILYGAFVGMLFVPSFHIGSVYSTPELALVVGNIFSYIVSPKFKLILKLNKKVNTSSNITDFIFDSDKKINFKPGQYLEWTMPHNHSDSRGNRRYFTIASSPTEEKIRIGVKFYDKSSSFKNALSGININDKIVASQLAGEFTLPKDEKQKLVFIAGGIGVTPFRSMIKYLIDIKEKRDIILLYSNKTLKDIVYKDVFDIAEGRLGIKTMYVVTDEGDLGENLENIHSGQIDRDLIMKKIPDYTDRTFYISGPHGMIVNFEETLKNIGLPKKQIKTDFFPGFA